MRKPLVVVVEMDEGYLAPLEMKLAFLAGDEVNFEFITTKEMYQSYFLTLRNIDVLVISEAYFTEEIKRHNIDRICVLSEENEKEIEEKNIKSSVIRFFKYSNLNALINIILSDIWMKKSGGAIKGQLIVVLSPSGGSGCTTVAVGIAEFLTNKQRRVFYMNTQEIQDFQYFFADKECLPIDAAVKMKESQKLYTALKPYIKKENFDYLPELPSTRQNLKIKMNVYDQLSMLLMDSQDYDFVIVDIGSDLNLGEWDMLERADRVLVLTEQDEYSLYKMKRLEKFIDFGDRDKFLMVCNKYQPDKKTYINGCNVEEQSKIRIREYIENMQQPITIKKISSIEGIQRIGMLMF